MYKGCINPCVNSYGFMNDHEGKLASSPGLPVRNKTGVPLTLIPLFHIVRLRANAVRLVKCKGELYACSRFVTGLLDAHLVCSGL